MDVGVVEVSPRNGNGGRERRQLEGDFVANRGSQRYYVQSAFAMDSEEKTAQEIRPLLHIPDSFKKIIIVRDNVIPKRDEQGVLTLGVREFLWDERSLEI